MTRDDLTGPEFTDHYSEALHEVIEAKREDRQLTWRLPRSRGAPDASTAARRSVSQYAQGVVGPDDAWRDLAAGESLVNGVEVRCVASPCGHSRRHPAGNERHGLIST
jgi:hypothetical protein